MPSFSGAVQLLFGPGHQENRLETPQLHSRPGTLGLSLRETEIEKESTERLPEFVISPEQQEVYYLILFNFLKFMNILLVK